MRHVADLGARRARRAEPHPAGQVVLALVSTLVLAGCGGTASPVSGTAPSASRSTHLPTPAASPEAAGIPDDFPLGRGLVADGETRVTAPQRDVKGIRLEQQCWDSAWPGPVDDRLVVQQVGPELGVTRELAVYRDAATAETVGDRIRADAAHCHRLPATSKHDAMDVTLTGPAHTGNAHVVASFAETLSGGQPGGSVFVVTRVGRALLAVEDSGEWTHDSA